MTVKDLGYGLVEFEGTQLALKQQPYIDGFVNETPVYKAIALDHECNEYEVEWHVVDYWRDLEDEQEMVEDWSIPSSVEKI